MLHRGYVQYFKLGFPRPVGLSRESRESCVMRETPVGVVPCELSREKFVLWELFPPPVGPPVGLSHLPREMKVGTSHGRKRTSHGKRELPTAGPTGGGTSGRTSRGNPSQIIHDAQRASPTVITERRTDDIPSLLVLAPFPYRRRTSLEIEHPTCRFLVLPPSSRP